MVISIMFCHVILHDVIMQKGIPLIFHSDGAQEFVNGASRILSKLLDYEMTSTKAHNPQANAKKGGKITSRSFLSIKIACLVFNFLHIAQ